MLVVAGAPEGKHERQTEPSVGCNRAPHTTTFVVGFVFGIVTFSFGIVKFCVLATTVGQVVYLIFVKYCIWYLGFMSI